MNDPLAAYRDAIASIESAGSGDYSAIGPTHPRLGRALGRYQVMEENVGPWSKEAIGREVSPEEFLANPAIQDAIFNHEFGKYVNRYGPEGAAQAWFGGPGNVGNLNVQDALGTSVGEYGQKFSQALGSASPNKPLQARQSTMNAQPGIMQFLSGQGQQGQSQQPFYKNPDLWDTLAIGLGGMSTRPNEAIIGAAQQRMQDRRIDRRETEQRNQTLQWLASQGRDDLVAAVTAGLPITDAMNIALTPAQMPEQTSAMQNYQFLISQGVDPQSAIDQAFGGGQTINVDTAGDAFNTAFAKADVETLAAVTNAGLSAQQNLIRINQLESLLQTAPQGATGEMIRIAGNLGIAGEFTDDVQAAVTIINQLVPLQRPAGSGQMSDRDVVMFKQSVPRIINQPGGNALILKTIRAINEYDAQGAQIVQQLRSGQIDRQSAMQALLNRQNPLMGLSDQSGGISTTTLPPASGGFSLSQEALDAINRYE